MKKYCHIPAFGDWDFSDGVPITQYFDSARNFFVEDKDLFPVPVQIIPAYAYHHQIKVQISPLITSHLCLFPLLLSLFGVIVGDKKCETRE